jgi:BMFP domain-containing protein YqiC
LVSRVEFEARTALASAARAESAALKSRVDALEAAAAARPKRRPAGEAEAGPSGQ